MEDLTKLYFRDGWQSRDTRLKKLHSIRLRDPVFHDFHVFGRDELLLLSRRDSFFNDFLGKGKLKWSAWIQFRSEGSPWLIGFQRSAEQGQFESRDIALLQPLYRSLAEAAILSEAVGRSVLSGVIDAFDLMARPAVALDRNGCVIKANSTAQAAFDDDVRIRNKRIAVSDDRARRDLELLFDRMKILADIEPLISNPITVRRPFRPPLVFRLFSVPAAARSPFLGARAILTISDLAKVHAPGPGLLQLILGLSPAQARLATHLAGGGSIDEASEKLQLSRETLRSQLKVLFDKTATSRQGELVAMLSRLDR
jgi:DNA-binding CsgD family transcriptional regulator